MLSVTRWVGVALVVALGWSAAAAGRSGAAGDPQERLLGVAPAAPADPAKPPPTRPCPEPPCFDPADGRTPTAFLAWVGRDVAGFWEEQASGVPVSWSRGRQIVVARGRTARTRCTRRPVTSNDGPFYCSRDRPRTVFVPAETLRTKVLRTRTWTGWRRHDFALAYVVAHEWAHHLQDVMQILHRSSLKSIQIELQADCLSGVWAHEVWARELLEPGDITEALRLARLAGDAPGTPKNDPRAHGSATERVKWFRRGYDSGEAARCIVRSP